MMTDWSNINPEDFKNVTDSASVTRFIVDSDLKSIQLIAPSNPARKSVTILNMGLGTVYFGFGDYITTTYASFPLAQGEVIILDHTRKDIYAVSGSGANEIAVLVE